MHKGPLSDQIVREFERMSGQLRNAARYVLDQPDDVALLSMREQARRAGVQPATMTRFAQFLGLDGYDRVRELYTRRIRSQGNSFALRADAQFHSQQLRGERALAVDIVQAIVEQATNILKADVLDEIIKATDIISSCKTVFCLGLRSSHPVAWQIYYINSLLEAFNIHIK